MTYERVVDADGHILEPPSLWEEYLESRYRGRGIYWKTNADGLEYIEIDGKPSTVMRPGVLGHMGGVGGYPDKSGDRTKLYTPGVYKYLDAAPPGSMDPEERVRVLDKEGIDAAVLYPTIGLSWEDNVDDPALNAALCRAYNNWLFDFCKSHPDRLVPVAHIPMLDVNDALAEMRRTARLGARGFFVRPDLVSGRSLGHPSYHPLWAEAQDMDIALAPHLVGRARGPMAQWMASLGSDRHRLFSLCYVSMEVQAAFTVMVISGAFRQFPRLKYAILESGGGWIAHWLERMDHKYKIVKGLYPLGEQPSFYFRRHCCVSVDPDETTTAAMVQLVGEDYFSWASDFPHVDADYGVVAELREHIASLPEGAQSKVLGANAARLYGLRG